jgi:hypothetical protein
MKFYNHGTSRDLRLTRVINRACSGKGLTVITWLFGWISGWVFLVLVVVLCPISRTVAVISPMLWSVFKLISHRHVWRKLTSEADYGRFGRHWGYYHGIREKECVLCGRLERDEMPNGKGLGWDDWLARGGRCKSSKKAIGYR